MNSAKSVLFLLFFIATGLFLSSWKFQGRVDDSVVERLFGKWNWLQTHGGTDRKIYSPSTVKYSEVLEFNRDGTFKRYKDGKTIVGNNFILTIDSAHSRPRTYWLKNVGRYSQSITFKGKDTLVLTDQCDHCFISIYTRQK